MKKSYLYYLLYLIFPVIFNLLLFTLNKVEDFTTAMWIAFGFVHFAYVIFLLTPVTERKTLSGHIFRDISFLLSGCYFLVELIVGTIVICVSPSAYIFSLILQIVLFAIFLAALLIMRIFNAHTADAEVRTKREGAFIKVVSMQLQTAMSAASDETLRREIEKAYDMMHASASRSCQAVKPLEDDITELTDELLDCVDGGRTEEALAVAVQLQKKIDQRTRRLMFEQS